MTLNFQLFLNIYFRPIFSRMKVESVNMVTVEVYPHYKQKLFGPMAYHFHSFHDTSNSPDKMDQSFPMRT